MFVQFGAWFAGTSFSFSQYGTFVSAGLLSFFGGVDVALPFMPKIFTGFTMPAIILVLARIAS